MPDNGSPSAPADARAGAEKAGSSVPAGRVEQQPVRKARIVQRGASPAVSRVGGRRRLARDLYHLLVTAPWSVYLALLVSAFFAFNGAFACLYALRPGSIANAAAGSYLDAFFFSVETLATVGYGVMSPASLYGHLLATAEIVSGMLGVAIATGLTLAKFTRPTSRVLFSDTAVVAVFDGCPTLMFRAANMRSNHILQAQVKLTVVRPDVTPEGYAIRRFVDIGLVRDSSPVFALTWTVMHRIEAGSPLHGLTKTDWTAADIELIAVITGIDETFSSTIHSRQSYVGTDLEFDRVFTDMIRHGEDGVIHVDYHDFHATRDATVKAALP